MSEIEGGPGPALFDPLGGVIDAELTVKVPRDHVRPCNKRIVEIARGPRKISLKSTDDETWTVDNLIVATGVDSPSLIAMTGAPIPKSIYRHVRFTLRPAGALASFDCCFLDRRRRLPFRWSFYGLRLNNETIAIGGGWSDAPFAVESWEPSEVLERSELQIRSWLDLYSKGPTALVSTLQCVHPRLEIRNNLPYEIMNTDGILTIRGNDLFKFAPAIACDVCDMLHIPMATTR